MKALVYNLFECTPELTLFFLFWPFVTALFLLFDESPDGKLYRLAEVFSYSWRAYLDLGNPKEMNPEHFRKLMFLHKLIGRFAWAYIVAIFIVTIG